MLIQAPTVCTECGHLLRNYTATPEEWLAHYQTLSMKELKRVVGESMGMSTSGDRATLLARIASRYEEEEAP